MGEPYVSEIRIVSFNFPPKGWAMCNGQTLSIQQNSALFSLLGTTYGGNGVTTFQLPNLQARIPLHMGNGFSLGAFGGEEYHTLSVAEMPFHNHTPAAASVANVASPAGAVWADSGRQIYSTAVADTAMSNSALEAQGGGQPHENESPYLVLNFIIALVGIFPTHPD
jgi:microcystin-dependent protein